MLLSLFPMLVPALLLSALAPPALPVTPGDPFVRLPAVYVCDSSADAVFRLVDLDGDGAMNGPGEAVAFYDESIGSVVLGNPCAIVVTPAGEVFVSDSTQDQVLRFVDLDGDGTAHGPGEHGIFFDGSSGTNAAGLVLGSSFAMALDANGRLWLTNSDYGAGSSPDCIYWIEDLNADGDAFDAGESQIYYFTPTGGAVGDSAPSSLAWGQDGRLYYVENGHSGFQPKGIYALDDINNDGFIDPLTEVSPFYLPPSHPTPGVFYVLAEDDDGHWLLPDLIGGNLWRLKDGNGDDVITHEWEAEVVWNPAQSQVWGIDGVGDGSYYLAESANPDRVLRLEDVDFDGLFEGGEVSAIYADNVSDTLIAAPRAIAVGDLYLPGTVVCDGGPLGACPCGNQASTGEGCQNSTASGAELAGFGRLEVAEDDYVLRVRALPPNQSGVFLQGGVGTAVPFRDGLLCLQPPTARLEAVQADAAGCAVSTVSLAVEGSLQPGDQRGYQFWYRDPAGPCGAGSNLTNGWQVDWQ